MLIFVKLLVIVTLRSKLLLYEMFEDQPCACRRNSPTTLPTPPGFASKVT